ncbi:hypothetical protein COO60DRAFT_1480624 [Scenedesmus sp. NREL 46B-D3]|nr:hypothetical protein COO60DRAFT_1480624 [Scenedesmus sp. NREL 46B-D3]
MVHDLSHLRLWLMLCAFCALLFGVDWNGVLYHCFRGVSVCLFGCDWCVTVSCSGCKVAELQLLHCSFPGLLLLGCCSTRHHSGADRCCSVLFVLLWLVFVVQGVVIWYCNLQQYCCSATACLQLMRWVEASAFCLLITCPFVSGYVSMFGCGMRASFRRLHLVSM